MTVTGVRTATRAVFFDVDFTLIHPGPVFQAEGYTQRCAAHGVTVDPLAFDRAVASAAAGLDAGGGVYDPQVFVTYTQRIIEGMGGRGPNVEAAARDLYAEWAACHHFDLYEEVPDVLRVLRASGLLIGLISNTQRCLTTFARHFDLDGFFSVAVSSSNHGYMKPHPSIFRSALDAVSLEPADAVMVGDSLAHDIEGARSLGMRAVLVSRGDATPAPPPGVPVIRTLRELPPLLLG